MDDEASPEFQVACMNFINVIVHSADDLNFRVHLQHEFTLLGLDDFIEASVCVCVCVCVCERERERERERECVCAHVSVCACVCARVHLCVCVLA